MLQKGCGSCRSLLVCQKRCRRHQMGVRGQSPRCGGGAQHRHFFPLPSGEGGWGWGQFTVHHALQILSRLSNIFKNFLRMRRYNRDNPKGSRTLGIRRQCFRNFYEGFGNACISPGTKRVPMIRRTGHAGARVCIGGVRLNRKMENENQYKNEKGYPL